MNRDQYIKAEIEKINLTYAQLSPRWRKTYLTVFESPGLWNEYDGVIQRSVNTFTENLKKNDINPPLDFDWTLIKAMIWVESSGPFFEGGTTWHSKPYQIGAKAKDPGMDVVLNGKEKISLIWPKDQRKNLTEKIIATDGPTNVKVGIAYLLNRLMQRNSQGQITGWLSMNPENLAKAYNGGGDADYATKIRYVQAIMSIAREAEFMR